MNSRLSINLPIFFFLILSLSSCIGFIDYRSTSSSYIVNSTVHEVQILTYREGQVQDALWQIAPGDTARPLDQYGVYGKSLGAPYGYDLQIFDSVVIWFDSLKSSKHQRFTDTIACGRCIPTSSNRSISNRDNWTPTITYENKHFMEGYFTYTITEQDYLNAQ